MTQKFALNLPAVLFLPMFLAATPPCITAATRYLDYGVRFFEPTEEVITPHVAWARPLAGGPIRVLFLTNRKAVREIVEIAQRIELTYDVFATEMQQEFSVVDAESPVIGTDRESMEKRLRDRLAAEHDVIVAGNFKWDILPGWAREQIVEKVAGGTGLVGCLWMGADELLDGLFARRVDTSLAETMSPFPFGGLPAFGDHSSDVAEFDRRVLRIARHGEGRVAMLQGFTPPVRQMLTPPPDGDPLDIQMAHYDYYLGLPIRLIRWAARREPVVRIRRRTWGLDGEQSLRAQQSDAVEFALHSDAVRTVELECTVRDGRGHEWATRRATATLARGVNSVGFESGPLPAGHYFADLWVRESEAVVDFGSLHLEVRSRTRLADLELTADHFRKEQPVEGTVVVTHPAESATLLIRQLDGFGRLVCEVVASLTARDADTGRVAFTLPPHPESARAIVQYVRVSLQRGGSPVDIAWKAFSFSNLHPPRDIRHAVFESSGGPSFIDHLLARQYFLAGFDSYWVNPDETRLAPVAARANLYRMTTDMGPSSAGVVGPEERPARSACLTDPVTIGRIHELGRRLGARLGKFSNCDFSLASEGSLIRGARNVCFSPSCVRDFQDFLRVEYGTLDALNSEYDSHYSAWRQILPVSREEAVATGRAPLWVDHRRHMESVWASFFRISRTAIEAAVPGARVGYQATDSLGHMTSHGGVDYWKLARAMNLNCPYSGPFQLEAARDFAAPGTLLGGSIYGGYEGGRYASLMRWIPWHALMRGGHCLSVFRGMGHLHTSGKNTGNVMNVVAPDLSFYPYFRHSISQVQEMKRGVGRLFMEAERENDGIAVLYSAASTHVASLTPGLPPLRDVLRAVPELFEDQGLQCRILSYQQLAEGALNDGSFRLLYLPYCQALSGAEVREIRRFVQGGGAVLADLRPGMTDEHGRPYARGALDDVFGVRHDTRAPAVLEGVVTVRRLAGEAAGRLMLTFSDAALRPTTGEVLGECAVPPLLARGGQPGGAAAAPVLIRNRFGKGTTFLLNFSLADYGVEAGSSRRVGEFLLALLATVDIRPEIRLTPAAARALSGCYRFRSGAATYVGVLRHPAGHEPGHDATRHEIWEARPIEVRLELADTVHVYDARRGEYLGRRDRLTHTLEVADAWILGLMPYRVEGVNVVLDAPSLKQGVVLTGSIEIEPVDASPGKHVLNLRWFDPQGEELLYHARNHVAEKGRCEFRFPTALNEATGRWRLLVRDAATGLSTESHFIVTDRHAGS